MQKTFLNLSPIKWLFVVLIFSQFNNSAIAQVTFTESFDGTTFLPTGWTSVGSTTLWSRRTSGTFPTAAPRTGAGMARFAARGAAAKTIQTIASPSFDLSNRKSNTPKVSLWIFRDNGSTLGDSLSLYINTSASLTSAVFIGTIARYSKLKMPDTVFINAWYQYTFSVPSVFNTTTNYILFKAIGEAGFNIHIDDVQWDEYANQCTGVPTPGTISATSSLLCGGTGTSTLSLNGQTTGFAGLSFQWKSSSSASGPYTNFGTNVTSISTGVITATRFYKCIATCSYSSQSDSTSVKSIIVTSSPNPIISIFPTTANYCQGSFVPVTLKATSATSKTYAWLPITGLNRSDTNEVNSSPAISTLYTVTGTDSIGCKGSANVTVSLRQPPIVTITATDSIMCIGDSVRLSATVGNGNTYLWSPTGQTVNQIFAKPLIKSNYSVTVRNTFGCATTVSKNLFVINKPVAKFSYSIIGRKVNFYDSSLNGTSNEWDFGDGNGSKKQNPVYIFVDDGDYVVQYIVYSPPCKSDTNTKIITIKTSGIKKVGFNNSISIFPNPAKNSVKISLSNTGLHELVIYNSIGKKVLSKSFIGNTETIDLTTLVAGIYNVTINNIGIVYNIRLIKVDYN